MKLKKSQLKTLKFSGLGLAGLIVLALIAFGVYSLAYAHKTYRNQYIGDINLSGKSKTELHSIIQSSGTAFLNHSISLEYSDSGKVYQIDPKEIGLSIDVDKTTDAVWSAGRDSNVLQAAWQQLQSIFIRQNRSAAFTLNNDALITKVQAIATELDQPESDYSLSYSNGKFILNTDRKAGKRLDQTEAIQNLKSRISNLEIAQYSFSLKNYTPKITLANANKALESANKILASGNLNLKYSTQSFAVDKDTIGGFVVSQTSGDDLKLAFNETRIKSYATVLAQSIDVTPKNAKLTITNGKVDVFQPSQSGEKLNQAQALTDIENALSARFDQGLSKVDPVNISLVVAESKPDVASDDISKYGINELVGTATTDFKNSPTNRVHNITIGASAINGVLLAPNEEFSTLNHLGAIDASTGYLPELVIKNNKTVPDFGGGLCQVSSTLFRAALNAGMKITERQNHSYRVSYYEPPIGMDATIFDPSPDFKFINNYSSHILIQSQIVGTKITFDFYGTKDNRKVEISTPVASAYTDPPPRQNVPTDTLPVGTQQQTQKAHQGATADFQYKVTATDGTVLQNKGFHSVYVALPEIWLVGTAGAPAPTCADGAQNGDETGIDCGGSCPNQCP